jgi:hypothetical protein
VIVAQFNLPGRLNVDLKDRWVNLEKKWGERFWEDWNDGGSGGGSG